MKSSMIALVVFVLGLTAYASGQLQQCDLQCDKTVTEENGDVDIEFEANVTIKISQTYKLLVFINTKTNVLIAIDYNSGLVLIYKLNATFGIVINVKTGACVKVDITITSISDLDLSIIKTAITNANATITAAGSAVVIISFTAIANVQYNVQSVFVSGSATIIADITATYSFIFASCNQLIVAIGARVNLFSALIITGFSIQTEVVVQAAITFGLAVQSGITITSQFCLVAVKAIQQVTIEVFLKLQAAIVVQLQANISAVNIKITDIINDAKAGVDVKKSVTVLNYKFQFILTLVREYIRFAISLGSIDIDISYSGSTLAVLNSHAGIIVAVQKGLAFIYVIEADGGFLIKESEAVYVSKATITAKLQISSTIQISTAQIVLYVSKYGLETYNAGTKLSLKDIKAKLDSEDAFVAYCNSKGISNGKIIYKLLVLYKNCISSNLFGSYSLDVAVSFKVTMSVSSRYEIDNTCYNNLIVGGIATTLKSVSSVALSSSSLYGAIKLLF